MISRRQLIQMATAAAVLPLGCRQSSEAMVLNDIHSQLNPTRVSRLVRPADLGQLEGAIRDASRQGKALSVSGGRHSMGGQQFGTDTIHLDMRRMQRVLGFDRDRGLIEVEAGIQWPAVVEGCDWYQREAGPRWGIRQKQTGADRLTLGGALAANAHGRGLELPPIVADVESLVLVDARGDLHRCSRVENPELFSLVVGGFGCFGVVYSLVLRLAPRQVVERVVEVRSIHGLSEAFEDRIAKGFLFGDFQFKTDESAADYLETGVFSCYRPVGSDAPPRKRRRRLPPSRWRRLLELAHTDKERAFEEYSSYYITTSGRRYWSDSHQLSAYTDGYHTWLDRRAGVHVPGSEMISEVYVPRARLEDFMGIAADAFRAAGVHVIYGTIRLIEQDDVTFLPWAREAWACIVFNFHVDHSEEGIAKARSQFRLLIDLALEQGGSYFLTYHRWARRDQVEACYPQMTEFLRHTLEWDPEERFQSDWYRHYREMYADKL